MSTLKGIIHTASILESDEVKEGFDVLSKNVNGSVKNDNEPQPIVDILRKEINDLRIIYEIRLKRIRELGKSIREFKGRERT